MQSYCKHPECKNPIHGYNKSRFCVKHKNYSTLSRYGTLKKQCQNRDLPINLSFKLFLDIIKQGCYYCGKDLMMMTGTGLDRKDNKLGYSKRNAIGCCPSCNIVRGNLFTVEEFKEVIKFIQKLRKRDNIWEEFTSLNKAKRRKRWRSNR